MPASSVHDMASPTLNRWLATGSMASLLSMLVLAWHGRQRHGSRAALINSPSHVVHGDRALRANSFSLRFTLLGGVIHHISAMFWAMLYEAVLGAWRKRRVAREMQRNASIGGRASRHWDVNHGSDDQDAASASLKAPTSTAEALAAASLLTGIAWLVDTRLVPSRLTPGFERRSSSTGMLMIYGAFAVGLTAGALMIRRGDQPHAEAGRPASASSSTVSSDAASA